MTRVANVLLPIPQSGGYQLLLCIEDDKLCAMDFIPHEARVEDKLATNTVHQITTIPNQESRDSGHFIIEQFQRYFHNPFIQWEIPFKWPEMTEYQKRVCQFLMTIPSGQSMTYGEVAHQLDSSARAVGNACRRNPFPIVIPCHRVVAKNGIGGYSGHTEHSEQNDSKQPFVNKLSIKKFLLQHEQNHLG